MNGIHYVFSSCHFEHFRIAFQFVVFLHVSEFNELNLVRTV